MGAWLPTVELTNETDSMDDLDPLRTIRQPIADLDPQRAARMRAKVMNAVDDDLRRELRPGERVDETELVSAPIDRGDYLGAAPHRRRRSRGLVVAAAAIVVLMLLFVVVQRRAGQSSEVVSQPEAVSFAELIDRARALPDRPLPAGMFAYRASDDGEPQVGAGGKPVVSHRSRRVWVDATGASREVRSDAEIRPVGGSTGVVQPDTASDNRYTSSTGGVGFGSLTYDELRSLPTTPNELKAALFADSTIAPDDGAVPALVADLLSWPETPPATRAAALDLLRSLGASDIGRVADHDGRLGVGIAVPGSNGAATVIVVDPGTVILLGVYTVGPATPREPGSAGSWMTITGNAVVASLD